MTAKMSHHRFPTVGIYSGSPILMRFDANTGRGPVSEQAVVGVTSGATAVVVGYYSDPDRVSIQNIVNGPGGPLGTPFLPGEVIKDSEDSNIDITLSRKMAATASASSVAGLTINDDVAA